VFVIGPDTGPIQRHPAPSPVSRSKPYPHKAAVTERLQQNPHLYERNVEAIVNTILGRISDALAAGDRVELRGFGAFTVKTRNARTGRNPKTGAAVSIEDKRIPVFKTGRTMQARLNASDTAEAPELKANVSRPLRRA